MKRILCALALCGSLQSDAALEFEQARIEVEAGLEQQTLVQEFKFKNTGTANVTIREADAGCSCLAVEVGGGKMTYKPGESGVMRANFEVGSFQGTVDKPILIWLEGDPEDRPSTTVTLSVRIPVIISLEPKTVKWTVGEGKEAKTIDVKMDYKSPIRVTSATVSNGNFTAEVVAIEEGKHYAVKVVPRDTGAPGLAVVRIETDVDVEKQRVQQGFAVVQAPLGVRK